MANLWQMFIGLNKEKGEIFWLTVIIDFLCFLLWVGILVVQRLDGGSILIYLFLFRNYLFFSLIIKQETIWAKKYFVNDNFSFGQFFWANILSTVFLSLMLILIQFLFMGIIIGSSNEWWSFIVDTIFVEMRVYIPQYTSVLSSALFIPFSIKSPIFIIIYKLIFYIIYMLMQIFWVIFFHMICDKFLNIFAPKISKKGKKNFYIFICMFVLLLSLFIDRQGDLGVPIRNLHTVLFSQYWVLFIVSLIVSILCFIFGVKMLKNYLTNKPKTLLTTEKDKS